MDSLHSLALKQWCEHSNEGVLSFDANGNILVLNTWLATLLGLSTPPKTIDALLGHASVTFPAFESVVSGIPTGAQVQWGSLRVQKFQPQQLTWQRIPLSHENDVSGTLIIFRDATTQGHTELSKQSFLSMISHDLRTPLSTILGYAELLNNNRLTFTDAEQSEFLGHIIKNANQLTRYAQIALDVMYLEAELQSFEMQVVALGRFVSNWLVDASHRLSADRIAFKNGYVNDPQAMVAPSAMHRILNILAEFALAESAPDGFVNIHLAFDDALAHVVVDHAAPELAAEDIPDLFKLMQPRDLSEKGRPQLHRMQLYVANLLAERQQGQLTVRDKGEQTYSLDLAMPLKSSS